MLTSPMRILSIVLGGISFILGFLGMFLPVLPTTPFFLLAAFFFSKGSTRMHKWLMALPFAGPVIENWQRHRAISMRAKVTSTVLIVAAISYTLSQSQIPLWYGRIPAALLVVGALLFIWTRSSTSQTQTRRRNQETMTEASQQQEDEARSPTPRS